MKNTILAYKESWNKFDLTTIALFIIWAVIDLSNLFAEHNLLITLFFAISFVMLFDLTLKITKDKTTKYKALTKSIYMFSAFEHRTSYCKIYKRQ